MLLTHAGTSGAVMTFQNLNWSNIHASAYRQADTMLRWVQGTPRPHGAVRYCCPVTGSFVLVTDEASLGRLSHAPARLRCVDCHEIHLVTVAPAQGTGCASGNVQVPSRTA